ncbi:MAG TPA: dienelactone hydrolase family protein [Anaerolineales bacterium]|nr:dienelactone hydrolase family protein [Anaerolineales bacterium]
MGRMVQMGSVEGYLGRPAGEGPWPTVIVIQEWWGLDNQTESIVDRFSGLPEPYFAFAPDLYHGEVALLGDHDKATALAQKYGPTAGQDLFNAFDALKAHQDCSGKVGSVGFCFGGRMSLVLGANRPVDAVCTFYGGGMQQIFDQLNRLKAPVLGLYGDQDKSIPQGTIQEFDQLLDRTGVPHEIVVYPNSGHAFFRDHDPNAYRPEAARDAWERVQIFFAKYLR